MQRSIELELHQWKNESKPKPLILRGARQVGKTYIINKLAEEKFDNFVSVNFEKLGSIKDYFQGDLDPHLILQKLALKFNTEIQVGKTLVFFDEIQACPRAIQALRYFYEQIPGLHIIAAGSLLEFALHSGDISVPVGSLRYLFLRPLSFEEFLLAKGNTAALEIIDSMNLKEGIDEHIHEELLQEFKLYVFLGGMPAVVQKYLDTQDLLQSRLEQDDIINTYRDDFAKYAKDRQVRYLDQILLNVPRLLSKKFKYSLIDPEIRSQYFKEALWLLEKAQVVNLIRATSGQALPFAATASQKDFKALFLDVGLSYRMLQLNEAILMEPNIYNLAAGGLAEQAVGQELLAYQSAHQKAELYYWEKDGRENSAELDYLYSCGAEIFGLEVKAGKTGKLRSLFNFMNKYQSRIGIHISQQRPAFDKGVLKLPCYAIKSLEQLLTSL